MKRLSSMLAAVAATTLVAAPAMAAPTSAQSLSVAKSVRASAPTAKGERLGGGAGVIGLLIAAGVAAIVVIAAVDDDNSDSN